MSQGNSQVARVMQDHADSLRGQQGGSSPSLESTDYKCNTATYQNGTVDLSGHASGGKSK